MYPNLIYKKKDIRILGTTITPAQFGIGDLWLLLKLGKSKIFLFFKKIIKYLKSNAIKAKSNNGKKKDNEESINLNLINQKYT